MSFAASGVGLCLNSVLVATDFSETSEKAIRHALAIARHYDAKFYLAHVVSGLGYTIAGPEALELASQTASTEVQRLEHDLVENGSLGGLDHEFIVRQGFVGEELQEIISQKNIDLVVLGTHGRRGFGKLLLGSVAEQVFRQAPCPVLTVGPGSFRDSRVEGSHGSRVLLFATDFGHASVHAVPYAISAANHFVAKLVFLHVEPAVPLPERVSSCTPGDVMQMREKARAATSHRLQQLTSESEKLAVKPEFLVEFGFPSEKILHVALKLKVDAIILGLRRSTFTGMASHVPWAIAYEVVRGAGCPVLTLRG